MKFSHSTYLEPLFYPDQYGRLIARVADNVRRAQEHYKFDAIAFRGTSGVAVGFPVSAATGIPVIHVRKPYENSHGSPVNGKPDVDVQRYAILDDFIFTGDTVRALRERVEAGPPPWDQTATQPDLVALLLWGRVSEPRAAKWDGIPVVDV